MPLEVQGTCAYNTNSNKMKQSDTKGLSLHPHHAIKVLQQMKVSQVHHTILRGEGLHQGTVQDYQLVVLQKWGIRGHVHAVS